MAYPLGLLGALVGALIGGWVVKIARDGGFYAPPLIGLLVGFGTLGAARRGGWGLAIMAGVVALMAQIVTEWYLWPFRRDPSLGYFLAHVADLGAFKWLLYTAGTLAAGWINWSSPPKKKTPPS